ncbi:MAG: precorrin-6y C5,15-methyltransferase (decarboxylating) subunit CbiE [Thermoplasmatales archaeon]
MTERNMSLNTGKILLVSISKRGAQKSLEIAFILNKIGVDVDNYGKYTTKGIKELNSSLKLFLEENIRNYDASILVMSLNGALRILENSYISKFVDPAVVVVDDAGRFCIPVMSGHSASANSLAELISSAIHGTPVITDGLDAAGMKGVEDIARYFHCSISNPESTLLINSAILNESYVPICINSKKRQLLFDRYDYPHKQKGECLHAGIEITDVPGEKDDVCYLIPDEISIGLGYRKTTTPQELIDCIKEHIEIHGLDLNDISVVATAKDDSILMEAANILGLEYLKVDKEKIGLLMANEITHISKKAQETFDVPGIAEPSSILALSPGSKLIFPFEKWNRKVTIAFSSRKKLFSGKITFIGVGPSDPELMTMKARNAIAQSDIVAGYSTPLKIASRVIGKKERITFKWKEQQYFVDQTIKLYRKGYNIAFLFTGDACFTESELITRFTGNCKNFEIIPGISSIQAASSLSGMPLEIVPVVSFHVTGDLESRKKELIKNVNDKGRALVIPRPYDFMPSEIARFLIENGVSSDYKITVLEKISSNEQRISEYCLNSILGKEFSDLSVVALGEPYY